MILELKNEEYHKKWIYVKPRREPELDSAVWQTFVSLLQAHRETRVPSLIRHACNPVFTAGQPTKAIRPKPREIASFAAQLCCNQMAPRRCA
jgi:hypothetical protein